MLAFDRVTYRALSISFNKNVTVDILTRAFVPVFYKKFLVPLSPRIYYNLMKIDLFYNKNIRFWIRFINAADFFFFFLMFNIITHGEKKNFFTFSLYNNIFSNFIIYLFV